MKRVVVIGIGIVGFNVVRKLYEGGLQVIAIDRHKEAVQPARGFSTKAILAGSPSNEVMDSLGLSEEDVVIVSFGEDLAARTLITLPLRQMKIKTSPSRPLTKNTSRSWNRLGATEVLIPEVEMVSKRAKSPATSNVLDFIPPLGGLYDLRSCSPKKLLG